MSKEEIKTLKFVCPECGGNELESVKDTVIEYPIISLKENGDFTYGLENLVDQNTYCFQCHNCCYEIRNKKGYQIKGNLELINWIKENCSQE